MSASSLAGASHAAASGDRSSTAPYTAIRHPIGELRAPSDDLAGRERRCGPLGAPRPPGEMLVNDWRRWLQRLGL